MQFSTQVILVVALATKVLSAKCDCEAGMGKCNHVILINFIFRPTIRYLVLSRLSLLQRNVFTSKVG